MSFSAPRPTTPDTLRSSIGVNTDEPEQKFVNAWNYLSASLQWSFVLIEGPQRDDIPLSKEHLQPSRHALTLRYDFTKQKLVTTPIDDIGVCVKTASGNQIPLYPQDKVWGVAVATDATGRLKVLMDQLDPSKFENRFRLKTIMMTIHGQKLLEMLEGRKGPERVISEAPSGSGTGLQGYTVFVCLRWEDKTKPTLLTHTSKNQAVNQAESPFDCTVSIKLTTFPVGIPHNIMFTRDCDPSRLIADITVFSARNEIFWYRSGFLWLQRYPNFPSFFEGSFLAHEGFWATFLFKSISAELTKIDSCKLVIPLSRINSYFKTRHRWVDVATEHLLPPQGPSRAP